MNPAPVRIIFFFFFTLTLIFSGCSDQDNSTRKDDTLLLDKAEILTHISESLLKQLAHIRREYQVEVVLATTPSTGPETIKEMTARLFTSWQIGRKYDGRGLLLLLAEKEKEVRIEVGLALEGVYTDLFTGYIEDKQLRAYFLSGQLETGMIAVLEEIELRASLMAEGSASRERIDALDMAFLSAGGGADVNLKEYQPEKMGGPVSTYPAGNTPEEAWQTLIRSWREKNRNPDIGVYTPVTRLIYRAFTSQPDRRFDEDIRTWGNKPYEVVANENFALIFFGRKKGWENAPFLFCRTAEGWQFDMVHQRKLVRMGRAPHWGIERGENPYVTLMSRCPYWMGQDIPRSGSDIYNVSDDVQTAAAILALEHRLQVTPEDFATLLQLGRLYTLTSMSQQRFTLLQKADKLHPDDPEVLKALSIAHVDAHYQYQKALELMERYALLRPADPFGHFYLGYLQLMENQPSEAIKSLNQGLKIEPRNIYGMCKLARAYLKRNSIGDHSRAEKLITELEDFAPKNIRLRWLKQEFKKYETAK